MVSDWNNDYKNALKTSAAYSEFFKNHFSESELAEHNSVIEKYAFHLPLKIAEKIRTSGPKSALAKQFLPHTDEVNNRSGMYDPIGDQAHAQGGQLIHRYESRALFAPTTVCPVMCRYCFRKNELNAKDDLFDADFTQTIQYLKSHPEIEEIIFTGGDPLVLSNQKLEFYLSAFAEIKTIKYIRFHTRFLNTIPSRIDDGLISILKDASTKFESVIIAAHTNHLDEFDVEVDSAYAKLKAAPVQLLTQTVLLKGVNDSAEILTELFKKIISLGWRPYYLHHPDQVKGGMHFYLPLEEGRKIYAQLRQKLPGWGIPHYVIDIPDGHGKVSAFNPETYKFGGELIGANGVITKLKSDNHNQI